MTPDDDQWLLDQYETRRRNRAAGVGNHVRPLFELIYDCPADSSEAAPR